VLGIVILDRSSCSLGRASLSSSFAARSLAHVLFDLNFSISISISIIMTTAAAAAAATTTAPKKEKTQTEEYYGPKNVAPGEEVFGICHIYASFNDTFVVCFVSTDRHTHTSTEQNKTEREFAFPISSFYFCFSCSFQG
jgi:hypothetical protein